MTPATVARQFCIVLNSWLTAEQLSRVIERNRQEPDRSICHSHDECDANQAMLDALEACGIEWGGAEDETTNGLIDLAWAIAKAAEFKAENLEIEALTIKPGTLDRIAQEAPNAR